VRDRHLERRHRGCVEHLHGQWHGDGDRCDRRSRCRRVRMERDDGCETTGRNLRGKCDRRRIGHGLRLRPGRVGARIVAGECRRVVLRDCQPQVRPRNGVSCILHEGLLQLANRLLQAASAQERVAEVAAKVHSTGVKGHGQSQGRHRVIVLAGPRKGDAQRVLRLHVVRVHADGLAVRLDGHGPSLGTIVTTADRVMRLADAPGIADVEHWLHLPRSRLG